MTSTVPTTLTEYQEYVRKEALKIQRDMSWPDDKLNATLRALGLPEKLTFRIPVEVTGTMFAVLKVDDAKTEDEARAKIADMSPAELRETLSRVTQIGYFSHLTGTVTEAPTTFEIGDPDSTMTNPSVSNADPQSRYCETYDPTDRWYCTRQRGHDGPHARGNGQEIQQTWPAA